MRGEGVTVFILDTLPEREVILRAAEEAGDDNLLLRDVSSNVTFNYTFWSQGIEVPGPELLAVGKDVYGEHYTIKIADHGLFVAGLVHDFGPEAKIECIRVMRRNCVRYMNMLAQSLQ